MILLKTLTIKDFISHENTTINFKENEKILLDGKSGSGKSSVTEAILWTLYGKGRSDNRALLRRGSKNAIVSLRFIDGERETYITRSISATGKNSLTVTQNTGSEGQFIAINRVGIKDTQEWIEKEFLKASFELFTNSIAYPQENENSFVKANASKRKDLLLEIIRAGNFDNLYEKTKKFLSEKEIEILVSSNKYSEIERQIKQYEEQAGKYTIAKKKADEREVLIKIEEEKEKELENKLSKISTTGTELIQLKSMKQKFIGLITDFKFSLVKTESIIEEHNKINIKERRLNIIEIDNLKNEAQKIEIELKKNFESQQKFNQHLANRPQVIDYSKEIEEINQRLIPLIKDSCKCPAGDDCPFVIPIKGQIDFLTEQIKVKTESTEKNQKEVKLWSDEFKLLPEMGDNSILYSRQTEIKERMKILEPSINIVSEFNKTEESIPTLLSNIEEYKKKIIDTNEQILLLDKQIEEQESLLKDIDINKINIDLSNTRITKKRHQDLRDLDVFEMNTALSAKNSLKEASTTLVELSSGISKVMLEKENLELLKEALSPRGVKAVVVDYLVPQLEDRINSVLSQMSDFRIRLDTQKAKADDDGVKEGLFITVINDKQEELPIENLSGGEGVKVSMAISEALASLMNQVGFRILDECVTSLDSESTESFINVLLKLQEKFPQVITISHIIEVKDVFEKKIEIIKINGISKINNYVME